MTAITDTRFESLQPKNRRLYAISFPSVHVLFRPQSLYRSLHWIRHDKLLPSFDRAGGIRKPPARASLKAAFRAESVPMLWKGALNRSYRKQCQPICNPPATHESPALLLLLDLVGGTSQKYRRTRAQQIRRRAKHISRGLQDVQRSWLVGVNQPEPWIAGRGRRNRKR